MFRSLHRKFFTYISRSPPHWFNNQIYLQKNWFTFQAYTYVIEVTGAYFGCVMVGGQLKYWEQKTTIEWWEPHVDSEVIESKSLLSVEAVEQWVGNFS